MLTATKNFLRWAADRTGIEGQPIPSRSRENNFIEPHCARGAPNGNDYGKDLLRQHYLRSHSH